MKKLTFLPLLVLPLLISCNDNQSQEKVSLTYGTKVTINSINELKELTNQELVTKTRDEKEVFLLAVYQGEYSESCMCWTTFENVLAKYMNTYNDMVYIYDAHKQDDSVTKLQIEKLEQSTPYLYVFSGEQIIKKFSYANKRDMAIFEDTTADAMHTRVMKVAKRAHLIYVDEQYLYTHKVDKQVVLFMRNGCGDCKYIIPNVIIPYMSNHDIEQNLYVFDMQKYYDASKREDASESEKNRYQELKDLYGLSETGNKTFGYNEGVVPTIQALENGAIKSASVYFNDTVSKRENGSFYISNSFYSEERLSNLEYLKNKADLKTVLKGMELSEGVLENKSGGYYLSQEIANTYHQPLLEAFLDYYLS